MSSAIVENYLLKILAIVIGYDKVALLSMMGIEDVRLCLKFSVT